MVAIKIGNRYIDVYYIMTVLETKSEINKYRILINSGEVISGDLSNKDLNILKKNNVQIKKDL